MRRSLSFDVEGATCAATLDEGDSDRGLLIVSGGNEVRSGAHRGMARLAAEVSAAGFPVLRFDRRGIGDSEGDNGGFLSSAPDIAAAIALMRAQCPQLCTIVAFGNCDAATALLLHIGDCPATLLLLANPWIVDDAKADSANALPPSAAIRARYRAKLADPGELWRLLTGGVDLKRLWRGVRALGNAPTTALADRVQQAFHDTDDRDIRILVAEGDGTGAAFLADWRSARYAAIRERPSVRLATHPTHSHGFADADASAWLVAQVIDALSD